MKMFPCMWGFIILALIMFLSPGLMKAAGEEPVSGKTVSEKNGETPKAENIEPDKGAAEKTADKKDEAKEKIDRERLKKEKASAESIERILKFGLHSERRDAVRRILSIKDESLRKRLGAVLTELLKHDDDSEVAARAVTVLGEIGYREGADAVARHLNSTNEELKIAAVYSLSRLEAVDQAQAMLEILKEQDFTVESNFTEALIITIGEFKAVEVLELADKQIKDIKTTRNIKEQLVLMLGKLESEAPKELLLEIFQDEQETVTMRSYAVNSLARLGAKDVIPEIRKVLDEIDSYHFKKRSRYHTLEIYCIAALARLGDTEIVPRLQNYLRSDNISLRMRAISLLKELNDKTSIDILKYRMESDPEPRVRKAAREALQSLGVELEDDDKHYDEVPEEEPEM